MGQQVGQPVEQCRDGWRICSIIDEKEKTSTMIIHDHDLQVGR